MFIIKYIIGLFSNPLADEVRLILDQSSINFTHKENYLEQIPSMTKLELHSLRNFIIASEK